VLILFFSQKDQSESRFLLVFFIQVLKLPAFVVLLFWFALQLINGASGGSGGGIAFGAHIGGFVAGVILAPALAVMSRKKIR